MTATQIDRLRRDAERLIALNTTILTTTDFIARATARSERRALLTSYAQNDATTILTDEAERLLAPKGH